MVLKKRAGLNAVSVVMPRRSRTTSFMLGAGRAVELKARWWSFLAAQGTVPDFSGMVRSHVIFNRGHTQGLKSFTGGR